MDIVTALKMGFALGVPASREVLQRIRDGVLVHRTRLANLDRIVTGVMKRADGIANARIKLTGDVGLDPLGLLRATLRDHRVVDFGIFSGAADRGMTDFVYFFLGEPDEAQMSAQSTAARVSSPPSAYAARMCSPIRAGPSSIAAACSGRPTARSS